MTPGIGDWFIRGRGLILGLNLYLILSLNFLGIAAHGTPAKWRIRTTSTQTPTSENDHNFHSIQPRSLRGENEANFLRQPLGSQNDEDLAPKRIKRDSSSHSGLSTSGEVEAVQGTQVPVAKIANSDVIDLAAVPRQPQKWPRFRPQVRPRRRLDRPASSISRFDEFGDYDYIDKVHGPAGVQFQPSRPYRPRPQRRHHHHHQNQPVYNRRQTLARPQVLSHQIHRPSPASSHHFHRRPPHIVHHVRPQRPLSNPPRPQPLLQHQVQQQQQQQPVWVAGRPVSNIADSVLNFIGLNDGDVDAQVDPALNSIDADYYADYESGAYFEYRPPSIANRVSKWFEGFKPPRDLFSIKKRIRPPGLDRLQGGGQSLDYNQYDTDEDHNLIFFGQGGASEAGQESGETYDFLDVLTSIRNNETRADVVKKVLSAAASLSERSGTSQTYVMWTIPTTILAILGGFYFVSAIAILGYQSTLGTGLNNGAMVPTLIALAVPLVLAFVIVTTRSSLNGQLNVERVMRGDFRSGLRQDFDMVDFALDASFGASALLGAGWLFSILV